MIAPARPGGSSRRQLWCQAVHDAVFFGNPVAPSRGVRVSETSGGVFVEPFDAGGSVSRVTQYLLTGVQDDYLICRAFSVSIDKTHPEAPVIVTVFPVVVVI